jgi:hypothetical protein
MKHLDDPEKRFNLPDWMIEKHPEQLDQIAADAQKLVQQEGYSEEQAYEIALERLREEEEPVDTALTTSNIRGEPLA